MLGAMPPASATGSSICDGPKTQNIVVNCGFETGTLSSWTVVNGGFIGVSNGTTANSGTYGAFLGPVGSDGSIEQTLHPQPKFTYNVSFYLKSDGGTPNDFTAQITGVVTNTRTGAVGTQILFQGVNLPASPYTRYTATITMPPVLNQPVVLKFLARNDPTFFELDDISVVPA